MGNSIKYTTGTESNSLMKGNFRIGTGDVGKGPTSTTGFYRATAPPAGGYRIYLNNESVSGDIAYHTAANDAELIAFTNGIADESFTTVNESLNYFITQSEKMVFNREINEFITDNLVYSIDTGFSSSYPEGGDTIYDMTASPTNLTGNATFTDGVLSFDGTDDMLSANAVSKLQVANNFTFDLWIKPSIVGGGNLYQVLVGLMGDGFASNVIYIGNENNSKLARLTYQWGVSNNNPAVETSIGVFTYGVWNNVVLTRNGGNIKFFVNGIQKYSSTGNELVTKISFDKTVIGGTASFTSGRYSGEIGTVNIYNRELTASEILTNFNSTKGRFGL